MSAGERARARAEAAEELIAVARVVKTRGVRGEVVAALLTDFPERFDGLTELIAVTSAGVRRKLIIENHWFHDRRVILKFSGYDAPETARELVGCELAVPETQAVELEEGAFYDWQLIDCRVETIDGSEVGRVREVLHLGAAPVLLIEDARDGKREHLIPLAETICVEIDPEAKLIRVDPPEGLLELSIVNRQS